MSINNKRINVAELDFDLIKSNLKEFLRGQSQFTDYDYEGSNMSVLLDVLAYNTHYRALYDNFILNEKFLDSASKRENVVSRAREIGYTPTSIRAATAIISLTLTGTTNSPDLMILPMMSPFSTTINGIMYVFITTESYSATKVNNVFTFTNMRLKQGSIQTSRFTVTTGMKYIIPNVNVDTGTMLVKVQDNSMSSIAHPFNLADGFSGISSSDRVYWLKEVSSNLYELEFGNNVIGAAPVNGNIVHVEYLITEGSIANGAKLFRYIGEDLYNGNIALTTIAQSSGGSEIESIDSIKFNAPRAFATQNRAVTVEDYRNIVYGLVPEAASVNVWSGSDNIPPQYGKVFICIKPKTVEKFTNIEKVAIKNDIIKARSVVSVVPEIIDPQYIKVAINTTAYINPKSTTKSNNDIKQLVQNAILNYSTTELQQFEGILRFSKLTRVIDDSDGAIVSNVSNLILHREIDPKYDVSATYSINLVNPIHAETSSNEVSIISTGFYIPGSTNIHYVRDDGRGNLYLYYVINGVNQVVNYKLGTVNYSKGLIEIKGLNITSIVGEVFDLIIKPSSYDIVSILNQLVVIPAAKILVNVIADKSLGASGGGANYEFTSSRS